jgi:hypothetical protein
MLRTEAAGVLQHLDCKIDDGIHRVYEFFAKDPDWRSFKKSREYKDSWGPLEKRAHNARRNQRKYNNAINKVRKIWGENAEAVLAVNDAQQFNRSLGQIAGKFPDYNLGKT